MTEDVEPVVRVDPERAKAFVRGLIPRAMLEALCIAGGVGAWLITGQIFWLPIGVALGATPMVAYVLQYARENAEAVRQAQPAGARVVRNIVE